MSLLGVEEEFSHLPVGADSWAPSQLHNTHSRRAGTRSLADCLASRELALFWNVGRSRSEETKENRFLMTALNTINEVGMGI